MLERIKIGAKRQKVTHSSGATDTAIDEPTTSTDPGLTIDPLPPTNVSGNASSSHPTLALNIFPESTSRHTGWTKLAGLGRLLSEGAQAFGPLKSAVDVVAKGVDLFENESRGREEYQILRVELESLFEDLSGYISGSSHPTITTVITSIAKNIEREINLVIDKEDRRKLEKYLEAKKDEDEVLSCYRRIQSQFRRLTLNVDLSMLEIVNEQAMASSNWALWKTTDARIGKLPNSPAATCESAQSESIGRGPCASNTRAEVLQQMHDWAYNAQTYKIYWLNGMAGTGKTTIAYSMCTQLDRARKLAASFFCSRQLPECRDVSKIIPSIAYQLSRFSQPFRRALSDILREDPEVHNRRLSLQFEQLIVEPLQRVDAEFPRDRVVVIDALDECEDKDSVNRLLSVILANGISLPLRFLVTSRPEPEIMDQMRKPEHGKLRTELRLHELKHVTVQEDIRTFLTFKLSCMSLSPSEIEVLVKRSGVLFIYAATVVRYVVGSRLSTSRERLDEVLDISTSSSSDANKDIDALYATILNSAFRNPTYNSLDREIMVLLLRTVICAREPLTVDVIAELTGSSGAVSPRLQPLLSVLHFSESARIVTTLHESFPDFILNEARSQQFYCNPPQYHARMSQMCFNMIDKPNPPFNICGLESSYVLDEDVVDLGEKIARSISDALYYACRYWGAHVGLAELSHELAYRLKQFLSTRLLLWLEVLNLKKCISDGARSMGNGSRVRVSESCTDYEQTKECLSEAKDLMRDALEFISVLSSGDILRSTAHIYISGLLFWPKERPIRKHYASYPMGLVNADSTAPELVESALIMRIKATGVLCIAYSPDGAHIVSGHDDKKIRFWDAYIGQPVGQPLQGHTKPVCSVAYSPDGLSIVSGSQDKTIRAWNAETGQQIGPPLMGHTGSVTSVAYLCNGTRIASRSKKMVLTWDVQTGQQTGSSLKKYAIAYSPDGACMATVSKNGIMRSWDTCTGLQIGKFFKGHKDTIKSVAYSPDGLHIVSGSDDWTIRRWSLLTSQQIGEPIETDCRVHAVAYSADSARIASYSEYSNAMCIWNAQSSQQTATSQRRNHHRIPSIAYSSDGAYFISGHEDGKIYIWNPKTGERVQQPLVGHNGTVWSVACSPNCAQIVSCCRETICIWDIQTGQKIIQLLHCHTGDVNSVIYSPDGACIASASNDNTIRIWCTNTGQQKGLPLIGHMSRVSCIVYSPNGAFIASGSKDNTVRIWDTQTRQQIILPLSGHTSDISSVAYSPDGACIISSSFDASIRIWNLSTGHQVRQSLVGKINSVKSLPAGNVVSSIAYCPNGAIIASGTADNTVRIWDAYTGEQIGNPLTGHTERVERVTFSPCGQQLASCSLDGIIRFWILPSQKSSHTYFDYHSSQPSLESHTYNKPTQLASLGSDHNKGDCLNDKWTLQEDGWIVSDDNSRLVWVPLNLRSQLLHPNNLSLMSERGWLQLDFVCANLGDRWSECYQAPVSD